MVSRLVAGREYKSWLAGIIYLFVSMSSFLDSQNRTVQSLQCEALFPLLGKEQGPGADC